MTITGWVDQVEPYIHGAGVFVMPFRMGSGTRLKLIEAFAAGKAVVSTSIGCEGYGVRDGVELCIADAPVDFAAQVLALLDSPKNAPNSATPLRHLHNNTTGVSSCRALKRSTNLPANQPCQPPPHPL